MGLVNVIEVGVFVMKRDQHVMITGLFAENLD